PERSGKVSRHHYRSPVPRVPCGRQRPARAGRGAEGAGDGLREGKTPRSYRPAWPPERGAQPRPEDQDRSEGGDGEGPARVFPPPADEGDPEGAGGDGRILLHRGRVHGEDGQGKSARGGA